jgi:isoleucyl-tRNA synthetase
MDKRFPQYDELDLPKVAEEVLQQWEAEDTFGQSIALRQDAEPFVFYEGPPSANGLPGIHHVMARTIKDIFCRFQTQKGRRVDRKAGWDTHGLPVELGVEKELGITKDDIGRKISIAEYNARCREAVMRYTDVWNDLTRRIGFWLDLEKPYVTYHTKYIESVWHLLKQLHDQGLLYKGYTIQPYSPAAGTGLSSHELNQPGTYKPVKDTTIVAQFKVKRDANSEFLFKDAFGEVFILAWTTTPWTLPSNTALTVGPKLEYVRVRTFNPYTHAPQTVVLAKARLSAYFNEKHRDASFDDYTNDGKNIPWRIIDECTGAQLEGVRYEQLLPYAEPEGGDAFRVITGDFVTTDDGTGVVHTAPSFGADDQRVAKQHGIGSLTLVDLRGRFKPEVTDFAGEYVKAEYYTEEERAAEAKKQGRDKYLSVDERIAIKLKTEGRAFKVEKYAHNYPHCWRTDKPVLYYPLDSWFVRVTARKERLIELNKTINWKPESTGTGRFGNWLESLQDWNLSRSRYWGIPLPIWRTADGGEEICIGSLKQLKQEIARAVEAGVMKEDPYASFHVGDMSDANYDRVDLHRPYVDDIVLVSPSGKPMRREADLIDVWFDSGAMPYAQWHHPFENQDTFKEKFPAAFIAEGVDQTRGWFYTLHAIAALTQNSVAYRTVVSNGLVLDKHGQKMSKRLGNAVDPFRTLDQFGADAVRWYMIGNASPWENLKFDAEGIAEVQRKFFRALFNSYNFFALYANIDGFDPKAPPVPMERRSEMDRWVLARLNEVVLVVSNRLDEYDPTPAIREIENFVVDDLSNWYIRLNRRRFWKGEQGDDKTAAFQTLYHCLQVVAQLSAPFAPFFSDRLHRDLTGRSVHLTDWPQQGATDVDLVRSMRRAQEIVSVVLGLRKQERIRVRQPLTKVQITLPDNSDTWRSYRTGVETKRDIILSECNVKDIVFLDPQESQLTKRIKPDFKKLGARMGKLMKAVAAAVSALPQERISELESNGTLRLPVEGQEVEILRDDVEITLEPREGFVGVSDNGAVIELDITLTDELVQEGIARELVSRIQALRKDSGLEVTDRIELRIERNGNERFEQAVRNHAGAILAETLATTPEDQLLVSTLPNAHGAPHEVALDEALRCRLTLVRSGQ